MDVGDIYESQKIINEALNEWILSLNEEQVRTFVETLYQVISASQADDLITFTADWKKEYECGGYCTEGSGRPDRGDAAGNHPLPVRNRQSQGQRGAGPGEKARAQIQK